MNRIPELRSIDLHAHTTASDGSLTPTELVALAKSSGLTALAVTDHDTTDGLQEAIRAGGAAGIELVPGIEMAVSYPSGRFHMLGYLIDPDGRELNDRLKMLKENRVRRNERMIQRLRELGIPVTLEEVAAESGGGQIGRPHMALAMMKKGVVSSVKEAFEKYLADGAAAHVPKDKILPEEGIHLIHSAGGLAVMAHPASIKLDPAALRSELRRLREVGLDGLECYYSSHAPEWRDALLCMAADAGLLPTGGSDFHGAARPDVRLGGVDQGQPAPSRLLDELTRRRGSM